MGLNRKHAAMAVVFVVATFTISLVGLLVTQAGADAWRQLVHVSDTPDPRGLRMSVLRAWRDLRGDPPAAIQGLHGRAVTVVGLLRPEPELGGTWLVSEALALDPHAPPPYWSSVWIPIPEEKRDAVSGMRGHIAKASGIFGVGARELSANVVAAYTLNLGTMWVRGGTPREEHHDH